MKACIVHKPDSISTAREVLKFLAELGVSAEILEDWRLAKDFDFIVSVGGDGTILRLLQFIDTNTPPIFGINTGKVGLLTHCDTDFREHLLKAIEDFETEEFMRIECTVDGERLLALNEIAVLTAKPARMINVQVFVDGTKVEDIRCDGMLFSTPIGSTAYALSTGGPIIDPSIDSMLIVPVAPFKLGWKPWVVHADRVIEARVDSEAFVVADGHKVVSADKESKIILKKSKASAVFFKVENRIGKIVEKLRLIR